MLLGYELPWILTYLSTLCCGTVMFKLESHVHVFDFNPLVPNIMHCDAQNAKHQVQR